MYNTFTAIDILKHKINIYLHANCLQVPVGGIVLNFLTLLYYRIKPSVLGFKSSKVLTYYHVTGRISGRLL